MDVQLIHEKLTMLLNSFLAKGEHVGDLFGGKSLGDQLEDLRLTAGYAGLHGWGGAALRRPGPPFFRQVV